MTNKQLQWARLHDWFMSGNGYGIVVRDYNDRGGLVPVKFTDFQSLYEWVEALNTGA